MKKFLTAALVLLVILFPVAFVACENNDASTDSTTTSSTTHVHIWGEWVETQAPTCTDAGSDTRVCTKDSTHIQVRIGRLPLGHDYRWELTTAATETTDGIETQICSRCGTTGGTRVVPATGTTGESTETPPPPEDNEQTPEETPSPPEDNEQTPEETPSPPEEGEGEQPTDEENPSEHENGSTDDEDDINEGDENPSIEEPPIEPPIEEPPIEPPIEEPPIETKTPPSVVEDFAVTVGDKRATLSWNAPISSGSEGEISGYQVSSDGGQTWIDISELFYEFDGLTNGTEYTFAVRAVSSAGAGEFSVKTATPLEPPAPQEPIPLPKPHSVTYILDEDMLTWDWDGTDVQFECGHSVQYVIKLYVNGIDEYTFSPNSETYCNVGRVLSKIGITVAEGYQFTVTAVPCGDGCITGYLSSPESEKVRV